MRTVNNAAAGARLQYSLLILLMLSLSGTLFAQSTGDYRTRAGASGSWTATNIWQRYNGSTWVDVTTTPTSADGVIDVRSDASLTVSSGLTVDQLTINGTVTYNASGNGAGTAFTLANGTGTDLVINGTFIHSGSGNQSNFAINTGASWQVNNGGTYVHNSVRSATTPLDAATFSNSSTMEFRGSSTRTPSISLSGRTFGNLSFTSSSGAWSATGTGSGGITINGDLSIGTGVTTDLSAITGTRTINGDINVSASYNPFTCTLGSGQSLILNSGGSIATAGQITYGSGSTLVYNSGGTFSRFNEWTATSGAGYPHHVQLSGNTTLNLGANSGTGTARQCAGNLTIDAGSTFSMNVNAMTAAMTVLGNLNLNGTLTLSGSSGGNFNLGGSWLADASSTFNPNGRNVTFNGSGTQLIQRITAGTLNFGNAYFISNKSAGSLQLSSSPATSLTLSQTSGNILQLQGKVGLDLNGNTVSLTGTGGSIQASGGARSISSSLSGGVLQISGTKSVTSASGGSLSIDANVTLALAASLDPGAGITTISGTLRLDAGGSCTTNSPVYAAGSTLRYNAGDASTGLEWISGTSTGTGVPAQVTLTLSAASNNLTLTGNRTVPGSLTLTTGNLVIGSNTLTAATVSRTTGNLTGSVASGLVITGSGSSLYFSTSGTGNYLKTLTLNNGATATLGNVLNIAAYDGSSSEGVLTVTGTAVLTTGGNLALKSSANGTARVAAGRTTGGYIIGNVTVERYIPQNAAKAWRLLASTTTGQTIKQAWQENQTGFNSNTNPGYGIMIPGRAAVFGNIMAAQAAGFDSLAAGHSLYRYNSAADNLIAVANTHATNLAAEHGYFIFIRGDRGPNQFGAGAPSTATTLRSTGALFQGDQPAVSVPAGRYELVRNPFASRIDMRNIVSTGGLVDAYQVWDPKLSGVYGAGGYQTFTKNTGTGNYEVSPGGGSYGANGSVQNFIESGLAFFVQSTGSTGTVQVTEACKTSGSQVVHRPASGGTQKRLLFNVYALNGPSTDLVDGGYVDFNETYSNHVDIYDVKKSPNFGENFGILRNNTDLVVERRSSLTASDTIPFRMYQLRTITYRIDLQQAGFDSAFTQVYLEDKYTGTRKALQATGVTSYAFSVTSVTGSRAQDRFRLVMSNQNMFTGSGNWTDASRWSLGTVPTGSEAFGIAVDADAVLNTDLDLTGTLTMASGSRLTVNPGRTLRIAAGAVADFKDQPVVFKSDATGYGSLGQVTGTLTGASNVTVERYIPNNGFRSWRLLSVPTYGPQTMRQAWQENNSPMANGKPGYGTLITGGGNNTAAAQAQGFDYSGVNASVLTWNGTGWSNITGTHNPVSANPAYFVYVRGDRSKGVTGQTTDAGATVLRTTGSLYTGDQQYVVPAGGFALVPNPYASAIDFSLLERSGVANTYYVWDSKKQNGNQLGAYQTFAGPDYECLLGGGSYVLGSLNNTLIESGQAFLVRGTTGGSVRVKESAKITGDGNGMLGLRPSGELRKLKAGLYQGAVMLDAAQVRFGGSYQEAVNEEDAVKMGNPGVNLAVEHDQRLLAVEGRAEPADGETTIQFRTWNLRAGDYRLVLEEKQLLSEQLQGELHDRYTGQVLPLQAAGTSALSFTVNGDAASADPKRFTVVLRKMARPQQEAGAAISVAPNPVQGRIVRFTLPGLPAGRYQARLMNQQGQPLLSMPVQHTDRQAAYRMTLPASAPDGVLLLLVSDGKGRQEKCRVMRMQQP